jgi:hypothetical protein
VRSPAQPNSRQPEGTITSSSDCGAIFPFSGVVLHSNLSEKARKQEWKTERKMIQPQHRNDRLLEPNQFSTVTPLGKTRLVFFFFLNECFEFLDLSK